MENYKTEIDILKEYGLPVNPKYIHKLYVERIFSSMFKQICDMIADNDVIPILAVHSKKIRADLIDSCDDHLYMIDIFDKLSYLFKYY